MLKSPILFSALLLSGAAVASDSRCFANGDVYMVSKFGSAFRGDDNLKIRKQRYGTQDYYLESDTTSGTNAPVTLLLQRPGKGLCVVLSTPPVATLKAAKFDRQGRPITFVAVDQGTNSQEVTYKWDSATVQFHPVGCKEVSWIKKRRASKAVACRSVLE